MTQLMLHAQRHAGHVGDSQQTDSDLEAPAFPEKHFLSMYTACASTSTSSLPMIVFCPLHILLTSIHLH